MLDTFAKVSKSVFYCSFFLMKKNQKIKAIRQPPFFARKAAQETE
jgi:hypothetical protein